MSDQTVAYSRLVPDARQELRLPSLLKRHLAEVAARHGETVTDYMLRVIATDVAAELAEELSWVLTAPEYVQLLNTLNEPPSKTRAMSRAEKRAEHFFGPR